MKEPTSGTLRRNNTRLRQLNDSLATQLNTAQQSNREFTRSNREKDDVIRSLRSESEKAHQFVDSWRKIAQELLDELANARRSKIVLPLGLEKASTSMMAPTADLKVPIRG